MDRMRRSDQLEEIEQIVVEVVERSVRHQQHAIGGDAGAGKAEDGTTREHTDFHNLVFFGKPAETAGAHLHKGQLIYVEGQLRNSSWDDAASGQKRYRTEVVADFFRFLGPKQQQEAAA